MSEPEILTTAEACQRFKVGRTQLDEISREPGCPAANLGKPGSRRRKLRWPVEATLAWLASRNPTAPLPPVIQAARPKPEPQLTNEQHVEIFKERMRIDREERARKERLSKKGVRR